MEAVVEGDGDGLGHALCVRVATDQLECGFNRFRSGILENDLVATGVGLKARCKAKPGIMRIQIGGMS